MLVSITTRTDHGTGRGTHTCSGGEAIERPVSRTESRCGGFTSSFTSRGGFTSSITISRGQASRKPCRRRIARSRRTVNLHHGTGRQRGQGADRRRGDLSRAAVSEMV